MSQSESIVEEDESGIRLDRWFKRHYPGLTHNKLEKLLRTGQIRIDGKRVEANFRLEQGQKLRIPPMPDDANVKASQQDYRHQPDDKKILKNMIIYEDDDIFVMNKLPGLAVQGGLGIARHIDGMLAALAAKNGDKPKLVHRLDRETSGLLLLAKTPFAASHLTASFRLHTIEKTYCAITVGVPKPASGKIDFPLGKSMHGRMDPNGADPKNAETFYKVLDRLDQKLALVALLPRTGRTHQLRAHLSLIETPILGDPLYGPAKKDQPSFLQTLDLGLGLHLHAWHLLLPHPRKGQLELTAPLPSHMSQTFAALGFTLKDMPNAFA